MPIKVTVHPTAKIAAIAVIIAAAIGSSIVGIKRLTTLSDRQDDHLDHGTAALHVGALDDYLLPVIELPVPIDAPEAHWAEALAALLGGRTEVSTEHGRIDVMTDRFAIEVDRFAKWHEGIGQVSHYALTAQKHPAVAIILLPNDNLEKLGLIEETCLSKGIRLVLLKPR
jgi:hypothetical protein